MRYISTRGAALPRDFAGVLLAGLAEDGGLFVPDAWPRFDAGWFRALRPLPYPDLAARVMAPFAAGTFDEAELRAMCREAYAGFGHPAVVPLTQIGHGVWAQELFHGPTLAFKDLALQVLGRMFERLLARQGRHITIVAATSGDTGSAAIAGCRGRANLSIAVLHPAGRVSAVQRRQMTTVREANVLNLAIEGTFDDCQDLVKAMFADAAFRGEMRLSAMNSINWARIAAQIPYYVYAALALGAPDRAVTFSVPTGNFGNVFAAYAATRMGLPVTRLMIGANSNDILPRFFNDNDMSVAGVAATLAPSMDIEVSSNFERLLFELLDRDGAVTAAAMRRFRAEGRLHVEAAVWRRARGLFGAVAVDDASTLAEVSRLWRETGRLFDPHSAIGIAAARGLGAAEGPAVAMATAHPAKFPDAVERATGVRPALPAAYADLFSLPEFFDTLPNSLPAVLAHLRGASFRNAA